MRTPAFPSRALLLLTGWAASLTLLPPPSQSLAREISGEALGASVPWTTLEAESATTTGTQLGPDFTGSTPAREASQRKCVRLTQGQSLTFKSPISAQGFVLRYSLPDTPDGKGQDSSLTLTIAGTTTSLPVTSRLSHLYGNNPFTNTPADRTPRNFWDETRTLSTINANDNIVLQNNGQVEVLIDLLDLEPVPPPLARPSNALYVTDFGAVPNDTTDDRPAFQGAIAAARTQNKPLFIPPGAFVIKGTLELSNITIHGAGIWHTTLTAAPGTYAPADRVSLQGTGGNIHLSHFAITGALNYRNDAEPNDGIGGSFGSNSSIRNLWIEHTKAGLWLVNSDGLTIEHCRFRNTIADGMNLCLGMRHTVVRHCSARGTGDDAFAMWPATYAPSDFPHQNNRYEYCTAQLPFLAQAFPIYGGENNSVSHSLAVDIPYGAGIYPSTTFPTPNGFKGTTTYNNLRLIRTGGADGAIGLVANAVTPPGILPNIRITNIAVSDSPTSAIRFTSLKDGTLQNAHLSNIQITGNTEAITSTPTARGTAKVEKITLNGNPVVQFKVESPHLKLSQ